MVTKTKTYNNGIEYSRLLGTYRSLRKDISKINTAWEAQIELAFAQVESENDEISLEDYLTQCQLDCLKFLRGIVPGELYRFRAEALGEFNYDLVSTRRANGTMISKLANTLLDLNVPKSIVMVVDNPVCAQKNNIMTDIELLSGITYFYVLDHSRIMLGENKVFTGHMACDSTTFYDVYEKVE